MTYDAENRPLSVTFQGKTTCYVYGVDGARLKKIEGLAANTNCATLPVSTPSTLYFGPIEIRNYKQTSEQVIAYPHPSIKLTNGGGLANAQVLHRDHLDSVRAITNSTGAVVERAVYKPFGEQTEWLSASQPAPETKGWIGERFDADAGLQYLNARYYDPVLGMFLQPDWFDVTKPGVGTNRFSYSFNDPINKADQNGNQTVGSFSNSDFWSSFWASFTTLSGSKASSAQASETASALGWQTGQSILTSPLRLAEGMVAVLDTAQKNTLSGSLTLPDRAAIMSGDPFEIAGVLPIFKGSSLVKNVIDGAGGANKGERIVIRTNAAGESVVNVQGKEMSLHASKQATVNRPEFAGDHQLK